MICMIMEVADGIYGTSSGDHLGWNESEIVQETYDGAQESKHEEKGDDINKVKPEKTPEDE